MIVEIVFGIVLLVVIVGCVWRLIANSRNPHGGGTREIKHPSKHVISDFTPEQHKDMLELMRRIDSKYVYEEHIIDAYKQNAGCKVVLTDNERKQLIAKAREVWLAEYGVEHVDRN